MPHKDPKARRAYVREWMRKARQNSTYRVKDNKQRADFRKYTARGISQHQFGVVLAAQGNRCGICRASDPGGHGHWHIDHCHASNKVRGILCSGCNLALGHVRDNPETLERAARYLREAETHSEQGRFAVLLEMFG